MKKIHGNLLSLADDGQFDVIVHGCNCFHTMGAGIAKQIKNKWYEAYKTDKKTGYGDESKLGKTSHCHVTNKHGGMLFIVNAYTQYRYGGKGPNLNIDALRSCFSDVKYAYPQMKIGYPMIGAGLAGGDWEVIEKIIDEELAGCDHTLVMLNT